MVLMSVGALLKASKRLLGAEKVDIVLLDKVVNVMNHGTGESQKVASKILTQLKVQEGSWLKVDVVFFFGQLIETKYFALQILEDLVQARWKTLPREQCEAIKGFVVESIINISSEESVNADVNIYLHKLDLILVQIIKQEWPKHWPTIITDIVGASKVNDSLCLNNMVVLRLLSEEVFDNDKDAIRAKAEYMKTALRGESEAVFSLCLAVLDGSENAVLVEVTLHTLLHLLNFIPVGYIFESNLTDLLTQKFLGVPMFRCVTLQCLTEIGSLNVLQINRNEGYIDRAVSMLKNSISQVVQIFNPAVDLRKAYKHGSDSDRKFISNLAQYLGSFLKENFQILEVLDPHEPNEILKGSHHLALTYLLKIIMVDDVEVFKICLDYWNWLCAELYHEFSVQYDRPLVPAVPVVDSSFQLPPRLALYTGALLQLRVVVISRMMKPEGVLMVEEEQGEVARELIKDTDSITLYKTMRETLVYLTRLDYKDTEMAVMEKLQNQVNGKEWSSKKLNTLCRAIGSISGVMMVEDEKRFLATVIRDLLGLCEQERGKDNKLVIVSNIVYLIGQYPRVLGADSELVKKMISKLFEFMHDTHSGIRELACDSFAKLARKCGRLFLLVQVGETSPFIDDILFGLNSIICDLSPAQVHVFYEAVGSLISAQNEPLIRENVIERLMALPNSNWEEIISHACHDIDVMKDPGVLKNVVNILKTNIAACKSIGSPFIYQLSKIYLDMLNVYKVTSENISKAVIENGEVVLKQPLLKQMRAVKREILTLISTWVAKAEDSTIVLDNFVPPLFDAVLFDYQRNCPAAREPKVLSLLYIIVTQLHSYVNDEIIRILDAVFICTLKMIYRDVEEFPEHSTNFYKLLYSLSHKCFRVFVALPPELFRLIVDAVVWAFKHPMRNVAKIGLDILKDMLSQFETYPDKAKAQNFYKSFFVKITMHILTVVSDRDKIKIAGLSYYSDVLCALFRAAEFAITEPLNPPQPNVDFIYQRISDAVSRAFGNLTPDQVRITVKGFFSYDTDPSKMKAHLRDFLVEIKERVGEDTADLFVEEREREIQSAQNAKNEVKAATC